MRVAVFSTKPYDEQFLAAANRGQHELRFLEPRLPPSPPLSPRTRKRSARSSTTI